MPNVGFEVCGKDFFFALTSKTVNCNFYVEVEMYRHHKNTEESAEKKSSVTSDSESEKKSSDVESENEKMDVATITSSSKAEVRTNTSPKPDVVSSTLTLTPPKEPKSKSLTMLLQIFPGKPQKILEAKLREAKGDVVKALELCAKHFDQYESPKSLQKTHHHHHPKVMENNNVTASETPAKFFPPPLVAAAALHKSAFVPAPPTATNPISNFYPRGFEPPNFFSAKELFPFPPPLFPPSFFVGFSSNPSAYHHAAAAASLNSPNFSLPAGAAPTPHHCVRPCVDPLCGQCAPKVDSTAEDTNVLQETEDL